jgi:hypothetical protein
MADSRQAQGKRRAAPRHGRFPSRAACHRLQVKLEEPGEVCGCTQDVAANN